MSNNLPSGITEAHVQILRHTLGLNRTPEPYRNHFCAGDGHDDMPLLTSLVGAGLMVAERKINQGRDTIFAATDAGIKLAMARRHNPA